MTPRLDRLLRSLDRRGTMLRLAECAGIGLLMGAATAIAMSLLLWNDGRPSVAATLGALGMGALGGLLWGIWRRPSATASAIRADRQLETDDLFATAASLANTDPTDPWAAAVLWIAEHRSRELSASAVVLRRLNARAWGGIGLAAAVAVIFAILTTSAERGDAASARVAQQPAGKTTTPPRPLIVLAPESPLLPPTAGRNPGDDRNPLGTPPASDRFPDSRPATNPAVAASDGSTGNSAVNPEGAGTGAAKTAVKPGRSETRPTVAAGDAGLHDTRPGTRPAGGAGIAGTSATDTAGTGITGQAGSTSDGPVVAPWHSENWSANTDVARELLQAGRVPAAYRDLVRQYFDVK